MSVSLSSDRLLEIKQLAYSLMWSHPFTVCQVMSHLGNTPFCANGYAQLCQLFHVV